MLYFGDSSTLPELSSTGSGCVGSSTSVTGPADTSLPELGREVLWLHRRAACTVGDIFI